MTVPELWPKKGLPHLLKSLLSLSLLAATGACGRLATDRGGEVSFNADIRPILNQYCTSCHGGVRQKSGVSFIFREQALGRGESGRPTIIPGDSARSEVIARLKSTDPDERMPHHAPPLSADQIEKIERWIEQGAKWEPHWAFVAPRIEAPPEVADPTWSKHPIDRFVFSRLAVEGLRPSPEATRHEQLRRLSLDLTGLAPSVAELTAFAADTSPDAYQRQADRLLASPRFGERWASVWLDAARYADSRGYELDNKRDSWPYRDWVVSAFNDNLPYDEFITRQLAGDLLPDATMEDVVATAFLRQSRTNDEVGADDEEFRTLAAMDRVATTWSVVSGLTMNCVQCHSHPYDPVRHEDYYRFLAFFNDAADTDLPTDAPTLRVPVGPEDRVRAWAYHRDVRELRSDIIDSGVALVAAVQDWQRAPIRQGAPTGFDGQSEMSGNRKAGFGVAPAFEFRDGEARIEAAATSAWVYRFDAEVSSVPMTAIRIEVLPVDERIAAHTPEDGFVVDSVEARIVDARGVEGPPLRFRHFIPDAEDNLDTSRGPAEGPRPARAGKRDTSYPAPEDRGSGGFGSMPKISKPRWTVGVFDAPVELREGSMLRLRLRHDAVINGRSALVRRTRFSTSSDTRLMRFDESGAIAIQYAALREAERALAQIPGADVPVMADLPPALRRTTLVFERGNMTSKTGQALQAGTPEVFPPFKADARADRLAMARWFFAEDQPLTARVAVNRMWAQLFGQGLVRSQEDFGSVGDAPSHPELLDWLARYYQHELAWDTKALIRTIVTSATYRQSARVDQQLLAKDPSNRLLARGPRQRLTAEMVRDQALFASGLLNELRGGEPIAPPAADRGDAAQSGNAVWQPAKGEARYRRALYTAIKRTATYPSHLIFDMRPRDTSVARRVTTNTPLQALVTLNEPVHFEAAQALGIRMCREATPQDLATLPEEAIAPVGWEFASCANRGAMLVLSRPLAPDELVALHALFVGEGDGDAAFVKIEAPQPVALSPRWTLVASALLNLDAALMR